LPYKSTATEAPEHHISELKTDCLFQPHDLDENIKEMQMKNVGVIHTLLRKLTEILRIKSPSVK